MTFEEFLKKARRGVYQFNDAWRVLVVCPTQQLVNVAFDEAKAVLDASSLGVEKANYATRTIHLERGALIRFCAVDGPLEVYKLAGSQFTQIGMLHGEYPADTDGYLHSLMRSPTVEQKNCLFVPYVTL